MAIPTSKPLSLSTVQTEYGGSNPISMSEYRSKGNAPATGAIDLWADFNGTSNIQTQSGILYFGEGQQFYQSGDPYYGEYNHPSIEGADLPTGFTNNSAHATALGQVSTLTEFTSYPFRRGFKMRMSGYAPWVNDNATITSLTKLNIFIKLDSNSYSDNYINLDSRHYIGYYKDRTWPADNSTVFLGGNQGLDAGGGTLNPTFNQGAVGTIGYDVLATLGQAATIDYIKKGMPTYFGLQGEEGNTYNAQYEVIGSGRPYAFWVDVDFDYSS